MIAPLATIAFVGAAYIGWLALCLSIREVGGLSRIASALSKRQGRRKRL